MNGDLREFAFQWCRVALLTLFPIMLTAFIAIPLSLGAHPGDPLSIRAEISQHMT